MIFIESYGILMPMSTYEFERLYKEHYKGLLGYIYTIARKDSDYVDDIFQNTMENAFLNFHKLAEPEKGKAWLFAIAKKEAARYFHNNKNNLYPITQPVSIIDDSGTIDDFSVEYVENDAIGNAIKALSEVEQSLITLHNYYGHTLKEISVMWNENKNTVKSAYRRAKVKVRKSLEKEGFSFEQYK